MKGVAKKALNMSLAKTRINLYKSLRGDIYLINMSHLTKWSRRFHWILLAPPADRWLRRYGMAHETYAAQSFGHCPSCPCQMLGQSAYAAAGPTIKATKVLQRCSWIYMYVLNLKAGWFEEGSKSRFTITLLAQPIAQPISELVHWFLWQRQMMSAKARPRLCRSR